MSRWPIVLLAAAIAFTPPATVGAQQRDSNPNPMDSIARLPGYRPAHDTLPLLTDRRLALLPRNERAAWRAYLKRSREAYTRDSAAMQSELRSAGVTAMIRGPYTHEFSVKPYMTPVWFAADTARRMAEMMLTFQAPNGGWSKHVDFTRHPRAPGESYFTESNRWEWISTIDNDATTSEMRFLAGVDAARRDVRYEQAFLLGLDYLLAAQYPNGCWPQVYPLEGSYHDAATFNDDAIINVAELLGAVERGEYAFVPAAQRRRAGAAVDRALDCVLASQVVVHGTPTVWGQQHDPLTLAPTSARSYELTSLTAQESARIAHWLMTLPAPSARVVAAVHAAAEWFRESEIHGYRYDFVSGRHDAPGAGPLWARMYEIGTNRPIFSNRDGVKLYDWNLLTDRRHGYGWYTEAPAAVLREYAQWARRHPRGAVPHAAGATTTSSASTSHRP